VESHNILKEQDPNGPTQACMKAELQLAHFLFELIWQPAKMPHIKDDKEMDRRALRRLLYWQYSRWDSDYDALKEFSPVEEGEEREWNRLL